MVAMQCVFFYGRTTISMVAMQCVFCVFWQDNDINGSDAVRVFVYFVRTAISIVAMQCVFFIAGQRYKW